MVHNENLARTRASTRLDLARSRASTRLVLVATVALALSACAHRNGGQASGDAPCNPVIGAVVGGVLGAVVGADKRKVGAAAIGAGLGALACTAYNYKVQQTRSAEQVGDEYKRVNASLPPAPLVTMYRTESARTTAASGDDITVVSNIEVVPGARDPLRELREEFVVVDPNGVERSRITKTPVPAGSKGGAYVSTLQFTFPQGVPAGAYQVQSHLFVNGQQSRSSAVMIQVAVQAAPPLGSPVMASLAHTAQ